MSDWHDDRRYIVSGMKEFKIFKDDPEPPLLPSDIEEFVVCSCGSVRFKREGEEDWVEAKIVGKLRHGS